MSKRKKRKFSILYPVKPTPRRWTAEGFYNSPSDCKRQFMRDLKGSTDERVRLRVKLHPQKQIIFMDCVFDIGNPEFWPDDAETFRQWALETVEKGLIVTPYQQAPVISEETQNEINATLKAIDEGNVKALDIKDVI